MDKKNPAGGRGDVISIKSLERNNSTTRPNIPRRPCTCCRIEFEPAQSWHRLCATCYGYSQAGMQLELAARFLKGVQK